MFTEKQISQIFKNWNLEMRALKANKVPNFYALAWTNVARQFGAKDASIFKQEYYRSLAAVRAARRAMPGAKPRRKYTHRATVAHVVDKVVDINANPFPPIFAKLGLVRTQNAVHQDVLIADVLGLDINETRLYVFSKQSEQTEFKEAFRKSLKLYKYVVEDVTVKAYDVCLVPVFITAVTRNG